MFKSNYQQNKEEKKGKEWKKQELPSLMDSNSCRPKTQKRQQKWSRGNLNFLLS